jgi:hypothetical protein
MLAHVLWLFANPKLHCTAIKAPARIRSRYLSEEQESAVLCSEKCANECKNRRSVHEFGRHPNAKAYPAIENNAVKKLQKSSRKKPGEPEGAPKTPNNVRHGKMNISKLEQPPESFRLYVLLKSFKICC